MRLTPNQLSILQHALGVDQYGRGQQYRDYYAAGPEDVPDCRVLIELGLMRQVATTEIFPDFNCRVTEKGKRSVVSLSPPPPKLTRSQQRYRRFLEADCGLTFGEWLKLNWERA